MHPQLPLLTPPSCKHVPTAVLWLISLLLLRIAADILLRLLLTFLL
jgi:hypothetical protein